MPNLSAISQWGNISIFGENSSPHLRISTFSVSSFPIGVESLGRFGNFNNNASISAFNCLSWGSSSPSLVLRVFPSSFKVLISSPLGSTPLLIFCPINLPISLLRACNSVRTDSSSLVVRSRSKIGVRSY